jgi:hypothetical protein
MAPSPHAAGLRDEASKSTISALLAGLEASVSDYDPGTFIVEEEEQFQRQLAIVEAGAPGLHRSSLLWDTCVWLDAASEGGRLIGAATPLPAKEVMTKSLAPNALVYIVFDCYERGAEREVLNLTQPGIGTRALTSVLVTILRIQRLGDWPTALALSDASTGELLATAPPPAEERPWLTLALVRGGVRQRCDPSQRHRERQRPPREEPTGSPRSGEVCFGTTRTHQARGDARVLHDRDAPVSTAVAHRTTRSDGWSRRRGHPGPVLASDRPRRLTRRSPFGRLRTNSAPLGYMP